MIRLHVSSWCILLNIQKSREIVWNSIIALFLLKISQITEASTVLCAYFLFCVIYKCHHQLFGMSSSITIIVLFLLHQYYDKTFAKEQRTPLLSGASEFCSACRWPAPCRRVLRGCVSLIVPWLFAWLNNMQGTVTYKEATTQFRSVSVLSLDPLSCDWETKTNMIIGLLTCDPKLWTTRSALI